MSSDQSLSLARVLLKSALLRIPMEESRLGLRVSPDCVVLLSLKPFEVAVPLILEAFILVGSLATFSGRVLRRCAIQLRYVFSKIMVTTSVLSLLRQCNGSLAFPVASHVSISTIVGDGTLRTASAEGSRKSS